LHAVAPNSCFIQEFFKVVVVADDDGQLRSSAYIVDQRALVAEGGDLPDEAMSIQVGGVWV
jgi:hypothetical protein